MKRKIKQKKNLFIYTNFFKKKNTRLQKKKLFYKLKINKKINKIYFMSFFKNFNLLNNFLKNNNIFKKKLKNKNYEKFNLLPLYKFSKMFFIKNNNILNFFKNNNNKNYFFKKNFIIFINFFKNNFFYNEFIKNNLICDNKKKEDNYIELILKYKNEIQIFSNILNIFIFYMFYLKELYKFMILLNIYFVTKYKHYL